MMSKGVFFLVLAILFVSLIIFIVRTIRWVSAKSMRFLLKKISEFSNVNNDIPFYISISELIFIMVWYDAINMAAGALKQSTLWIIIFRLLL